jgi:hypothetical protein
VYVLRENKSIPTNLPKEGNITGTQKFSSLALGKQANSQSMADDFGQMLYDLNVVSVGQTDGEGKVTFKLVRNLSPNDSYIIWAQVDSTSALNYAFYAQRFTSRGKWLLSGNFTATTPEDKDAKWNDEYPDYSKCQRQMTLYGYPKNPALPALCILPKIPISPLPTPKSICSGWLSSFLNKSAQ